MSTTSPLEYERRIHALERINATLAAEIDRMAPVVEAAINAVDNNKTVPLSVIDAVYKYKIAKKTATKA